MNSTSINTLGTFLLTLLLFFNSSCNLDDGLPTTPEDQNEIEIGEYELLDSSLEQLPYTGKTKVNFVDEDENILVFNIAEDNDLFDVDAQLVKFGYINQGDTVFLNYKSQTKRFVISNDFKELTFNLTLAAKPYALDPEKNFIADVINIFCVDPQNSLNASQVFYHETNQRTWPTTWNPDPIDQLTLIDRTFMEVYNNNFIEPKTPLNFNYEFGILSFEDLSGRLWRFDSLE